MRFSGWRYWSLVGVIGLALGFIVQSAPANNADASSKVIVYPGPGDSIDQLKQLGIEKVDNYGSYWVVEVGDKSFSKFEAIFGDRAAPANDLNHIELRTASIDTMGKELAVPAGLEQVENPGRRLRIVQFKGPIRPEWLAKLKSLDGAKLINYVPNNAYLVRLDQPAEDKLRAIQGANGPIQWIGPYHPYYKIQPGLLNAAGQDGKSLVNVRVAMVSGPDDGRTIDAIGKFGLVQESYDLGNQKVALMTVPAAAIARIAKLSDVIWIEKKLPKRILDEVQDLVLAGQTNGPGNGPSTTVGITNYLDFLINTVGGGLPSIVDPNTYPIVDIADTGLDTGSAFTAHPSFHFLGEANGPSRVVYTLPPWIAGDPLTQLGCVTRINERAFRNIEAEDLYGHGTLVASVLSGFDAGTNILNELCLGLVARSNTFIETVPGTDSWNIASCPAAQVNLTIPFSTGMTDVCGDVVFTNVFVTILTNSCPTNITLTVLFSRVVTNSFDDLRRDARGFRFGLGVSPFGLIGVQRIFSQDVSLDSAGGGCVLKIGPTGECLNNFPALMAFAYTEGARIENNSWADDIDIQGLNGGQYTADSQSFDVGVRDALLVGASNNVPGPSPLNQELTVVFAVASLLGDAGSEGNAGGFADIRVTAPATAKNVISVGASVNPRLLDGMLGTACWPQTNSFEMALFAAAGPTLDGRIKPEIVAPGSSVYGALSQQGIGGFTPTNCTVDALIPTTPFITDCTNPPCAGSAKFYSGLYTCSSGSSFAAPAVSGAIQLLWWYFQNRLTDELGTPMLQPSPAMSKAYLCNSARYLPITNPQTGAMDTLPSILQGMGELDLQTMFDQVPRVIRDESTPRAIDVALITTNPAAQQTYFSQSGQSYEASGQIFDSTKPFRVTLAWTDVPGVPGARKELVNDLDLQVTVAGVVYKGNVFSENHSVPGGNFDNVNNMESVFLSAGQTGTWSVIVRAKDIAGDGVPNVGGSNDQDFALMVYNVASTNRSDVPNLATNNSCQTALILNQFPVSFSNTLSKAVYTGNSMPSPSAGRGGVEEFFKIVQPTPGTTFTVNTSGSAFNTILSVWTAQVLPQTVFIRGNCGALTELVSTNGGFNSQVTFTADGSNDYYIVAEPLNNGSGGNFVLNVSASVSPITITPTSLVFGPQVILTTSSPQTVTYQNGSTVPVQISGVSITGPNAADFSLSAQTCVDTVLGPGQNCFVSVVFTPQAGPTGSRTANLVFTDDATGSPRIIPLSGTATPSVPVVCLSSGGATLNFSSQLLGTTSAVQSITITNCGSADLNIASITITGFGSNDFSIAPTTTCAAPSTITPGSTCTVDIQFNPQAAGSRKANLLIAHDATGSPTIIPLSGVGAALAPAICFSSSSVDFGSVAVGSTGPVVSVTITNCGTAVLVISDVALTGANPGDFITNSTTCAAVATGDTCVVNLQFAPTAGGQRSANLAVMDNISGSPQLLPLIGNGALSQPDAAIGKTASAKKMLGNGIINTTGAAQEIKQFARRGASRPARFFVSLRNIGSTADRFTVQGDGDVTGFTVHYFLGAIPNDSLDVTSAVESGTFSTTTLAPGAITSGDSMIRIEVFAADKSLVEKGANATFKLTFSSVSDPTKADAVKATVTAK